MGWADGGILELRRQLKLNPEWESDLLGLYGFDISEVFRGKAPISSAWAYLQRLAFEPRSLWRAKQLGSLEHVGWSEDTYMLANLIDALQVNTVVSANLGGSKAPEMPDPIRRPGDETPQERKVEAPVAPSLEDLDIHALARMIGGGIEDGD